MEFAMKTNVQETIARVKTAYLSGQLTSYKPLAASGIGYVYQTPMTSWGPQMKR
ncbi:hypothetical protein D3C76_1754050 [compost metagenome]|jgi:hypothetical protein